MEKDELKVLFPYNDIELGGEKMTIRPFLFGKWTEVISKASGIVSIIVDAIEEHGESVLDVSLSSDNFRVSPAAYAVLTRLIAEGGDNLYDILAIGARKPREWVDSLEGDDGLTLLISVFLVNKDFFSGRVAPQFRKLKEMLGNPGTEN